MYRLDLEPLAAIELLAKCSSSRVVFPYYLEPTLPAFDSLWQVADFTEEELNVFRMFLQSRFIKESQPVLEKLAKEGWLLKNKDGFLMNIYVYTNVKRKLGVE